MRFIIIVKASKESEAGVMPSEDLLTAVVTYNEELVRAGVWVDGGGLKPTSRGWRVRYSSGAKAVVEGPFTPPEDQIAGYTVIDVDTLEEALGWAVRYPNPGEGADAEIEVREFFELDDFEQSPAIERFRDLDALEDIAADVEHSRPDLSRATAPNGTVTILFTDIEESTQLTERLGDHAWMELLREHNALVREQVARHSGFEVKSQGDGFMLAFASARDALRCALGIQRALAARERPLPELRVRIGLHTGEATKEADDFYGKAVILAARIAARARGSEILVSSTVRDLAESTGEFVFEAPAETELKGLTGLYRVSAVRWRDAR